MYSILRTRVMKTINGTQYYRPQTQGCRSAQQWTPRVGASDPNGLPTELSLLKLDETLALSQIPSFLSINLDLDFDLFRVFGVLDWR